MRSKNNGSPEVCVSNLVQIARGEVPYDRVKGVSAERIDGPADQAVEDITEDATWLLQTYEPRAEVESIEVTPDEAAGGHFTITANINTTKEEE